MDTDIFIRELNKKIIENDMNDLEVVMTVIVLSKQGKYSRDYVLPILEKVLDRQRLDIALKRVQELLQDDDFAKEILEGINELQRKEISRQAD